MAYFLQIDSRQFWVQQPIRRMRHMKRIFTSVCLAVTKTCQTAVVGQSQLISGTVTNCGNVTLTNITVSDNIAGAITNGP